jgi:sialic acid synthase SpsE
MTEPQPVIQIGARLIGEGAPLYFVADIAANHDGELGRAFKLIELAKRAGADAAKFQNFSAERIVSRRGFEALGAGLAHQREWRAPVWEVYRRASLPLDWVPRLKQHCLEVGIEYFTSPYDLPTVDAVDPYVALYKIGSGDIAWLELIEHIARKGKPVMLGTGAAALEEVQRAAALIEAHHAPLVLMQCNTNYSARPDNIRHVNLNVLPLYRRLFPRAVLGLSDHTHGHAAVVGAAALGARVFEKHFTDDNARSGPDHAFSMTPEAWREMVQCAHECCAALGDGIKRIQDNEAEAAVVQRRCLRYARSLGAGHTLGRGDLIALRPMNAEGVAPCEIERVLGKRLVRAVAEDDALNLNDLTY